MGKKVIRLTESDLHRIVKESVKRVLKEGKKVNNIPWLGSQKYEDGYQAYLKNYKDWQDFHKNVLNNPTNKDYILNRSDEIINSPEQKISDNWKKSNEIHGTRAIQHYRDEIRQEPESLKRFKVEWIRDLGDEWNTLSFEEKRDELAKAKDTWNNMQLERNAPNEEEYWYSSEEY